MNVWKRGFLVVYRKPIRSILLITLIYCLTALVTIGISASHTSARAQLEAKNQVGASFLLTLDMEDYYHRIEQLEAEGYNLTVIPEPPASQIELSAPPNFQFITLFLEDIEKLAQVDGIKDYNVEAMMNSFMKTINFERVEGSFQNDTDTTSEVTLRGVRDLSLMSIVQDGSITLIEGRWIQVDDENKLVISEELAELNQLKIGDSMVLETVPMKDNLMLEVMERLGFQEPEPVQIEGEIVGIFRNHRSIAYNPGIVAQRSENHIFSNLDFPKVGIYEEDPFYEVATLHVADVDQIEEIRARLEAVDINWNRYELRENQELIVELSPAFVQLREIGNVLLGVVLVSSFVILTLIFVFLVRGRIHEIGIWLSLGKAKRIIIFQMLWESMLVTLIALGICVATIPLIFSGAESYFNQQVMPQISFEEETLSEGQFPDSSDELERITLTFDMRTMTITAGVSMTLIFISIVIATLPILRLKPREIFATLS